MTREQICLRKQQQRSQLKNEEKPKRKAENTGCLVNVNTATVCQEQFGSRKKNKGQLGKLISCMQREGKQAGIFCFFITEK